MNNTMNRGLQELTVLSQGCLTTSVWFNSSLLELELGYLKVTVLAMHLLTGHGNFKDFLASVTTSGF